MWAWRTNEWFRYFAAGEQTAYEVQKRHTASPGMAKEVNDGSTKARLAPICTTTETRSKTHRPGTSVSVPSTGFHHSTQALTKMASQTQAPNARQTATPRHGGARNARVDNVMMATSFPNIARWTVSDEVAAG